MSSHGPVIVLAAASAAVALANWWSRWRDDPKLELWTKPLATVLIAALGVACAIDGTDHAPTGAIVAAIVAFAFCLGGDVALMPAIDKFVVGLGSFLLGHVVFVVMFVILGLDRWWLGLVAAGVAAGVVATLGRRIVAGAAAKAPEYAMPVRAYLIVISAMAIVGWSSGRPAAVVGASLFLVSDSILGWEIFVAKRRWMPVAIMVTYHGALAGLALSLW
jgi:uncharacterized membrane protein YhhN